MICRLCSRKSEKFYHFFDTEGLKMQIVNIIAKHFWFRPKAEDNTSHLICDSCWIIIKNFHDLYDLVDKVEKTFANNLFTIKEESSKVFSDSGTEYCTYNENKYELVSDYYVNQNTENISTLNDEILNFNDSQQKNETNAEFELKATNLINENLPLRKEKVERINKKRGRPPKSRTKTLRISQENLKNDNEDDEQYKCENKNFESSIEKVQLGCQRMKRSAEETAAFNKKVAEEEQNNFTSLRHHCTSTHGQQGVVICCGRKFYRKTKLVEHIEVHLDPEKHKCNICNHVSANRWNLKLHMKSLHTEHSKPFKCSFCGKAFRLQTVLKSHELIHMPEEERKFKCSQCEKNFPAEQMLKNHIRVVHDGLYAGVCDICGKEYNNRGELKRHRLEIHEGVASKFKCKYCSKEFKSKYTCNVHKLREHENTNPNLNHKCPLCEKTSKSLNAIKNHVRYVHKAKPKFECSLCNKFFKRELSLKEHMATHTGQSLYSCPHCPRTFTHSSNMHHHRKLKHPLEFEMGRKVKEDKKEPWTKFTSINMLLS